jgi:hypothetical protein
VVVIKLDLESTVSLTSHKKFEMHNLIVHLHVIPFFEIVHFRKLNSSKTNNGLPFSLRAFEKQSIL